MARDFAKKRTTSSASNRPAAGKRKSTQQSPRAPARVWRWYFSGLLTGVLLCFLTYLGTLPADPAAVARTPEANKQAVRPEAEPPKPRFDFYTMLPEQTIDVEMDPGEAAKSRTSQKTELYLLQAGSFRQADDAERRRAELLLLGLEPKVEKISGDNGGWFRVYVGPFESRSRLDRARSLTAAQDIDTLLLKRNKP